MGLTRPIGVSSGVELPIQFGDFAQWQLARIQGERLESQVSTGSSSLGPVRKCFTYPPTGLSHRFRPIMGQATVSRTAAGSTDKKSRATEAT